MNRQELHIRLSKQFESMDHDILDAILECAKSEIMAEIKPWMDFIERYAKPIIYEKIDEYGNRRLISSLAEFEENPRKDK